MNKPQNLEPVDCCTIKNDKLINRFLNKKSKQKAENTRH